MAIAAPEPAAPASHRVQRLVVELAGVAQPQAASLQAAARQRLQQHLLPVLNRLCAQLGDARQVQRIDTLHIDLGTWPADAWLAAPGDPAGHALAAHADTMFVQALAQALQGAVVVQADAELVACVLHTGHLPWWADPADSAALQRALASLLARGGMPAWLPVAPADSPAWQRLVQALDDAALAGLAARLHAPAALGTTIAGLPWADLLARVAAALGSRAAPLRRQWWPAVLAAGQAGGPGMPLQATWADALAVLPQRLGRPAAELARAWRLALDQTAPAVDAAALALLWQAVDQAWPGLPPLGQRRGPPLHTAMSGAAAWTPASLQAAWRRLAAGAPGGAPAAESAAPQRWAAALARQWLQWPAAMQQPLLTALAGGAAGGAAAVSQAICRLLQALPSAPAAAMSADAAATALVAALQALPGALTPPPRSAAPPAPDLAQMPDTLPLANAGLVLLWPFLQRFADRLGLLEGRQFQSVAHAGRAALLLQRMVSGSLDAPEFQLPLNKLLCGLPLDQPLDDDMALSADEETECDDLLRAVVSAAPVLRQMSLGGFRASFLLRSGQLRSQDGHWLLQVERQTHDLVMDRFPWSAGIVRLPWMPRLLQVQW